MGTVVTIEVIHPGAASAIERAFDWFRTVEAVCSRFDAASELMQLSAHVGDPVPASPILYEAVNFALHVAEESGGAFDPTVGLELHRRGFNQHYATRTAVAAGIDAPDDVSYRDVQLDGAARTITLTRPLMLDLSAVAKGLAVDTAVRELQRFGDFAVDAGGDLYLAGCNSDGEPWRVGIRHPRHRNETIASVRVRDQAVCTSGDYERPAANGDGHHVVDPRSGKSAHGLASVTVVADSAMLADAVGTAAFVLGPSEGAAFLERLGVAGLLVTPELDLHYTSRWPRE